LRQARNRIQVLTSPITRLPNLVPKPFQVLCVTKTCLLRSPRERLLETLDPWINMSGGAWQIAFLTDWGH
jgi:hypothetical protein